ncbi:hypothetical protein TC41_0320 [Alicyclobacillus acidocaldarius subsp. acidocaldarius Tc-4-1]|uniref:Uncharacterized protein n=1 Tax=Alicyclobacillus acidocaldarius (strain Tc-4-1) TaxID=1048834 RepID=F8IKA0_ALIAT|nr:hypothetical protein TC41_0320 [Alicyclobacillus acidocaldarius subsp. acidocaldarius Tc-4-1]
MDICIERHPVVIGSLHDEFSPQASLRQFCRHRLLLKESYSPEMGLIFED